MSEPSSLYMRVQISEAALAAFMQSQPVLPTAYSDWREWLDGKRYYGNISDQQIQDLRHMTYDGQEITTCAEYLKIDFIENIYTAPVRASYDPETQTWRLLVLQFSENFFEYIQSLSFLRAIANYKDLPGDDLIIVYPYLWDADHSYTDAYIHIQQGSSRIYATAPAELVAEADQQFAVLLAEFDGQGEES